MFVTPGYAATEPAAEGEAHTEGGGHHPGEGVFPPFDPTYFASQIVWLAITFGLFYLLLKRVVLPRLTGILEVRRDRIAQDLEQAAQMKVEADAAVAAYEQELAEARGKAGGIAQKARDEAKAEAESRRKAVEAELEGKLAAAEGRIAEIKSAAMKEVGGIAEQTAEAIVQELVGGSVSRADIAAAVVAARGGGAMAASAGVAPRGSSTGTPAHLAEAAFEADEEVGAGHAAGARPSLDHPDRPRGVDKPARPDDLGLIRGVGPKIEGILHSLGIFTFAQIAAWTAAERAWVDGYLNFKGRIDRDDWVRQADALARGGVDEYVRVFGKQPK